MFKRKSKQPVTAPDDPQAILGPELAAELVNLLGPDKLATFTAEVVADAKQRWARRFEDKDLISNEELMVLMKPALEKGTPMTKETTAALLTLAMAKKLSVRAAATALTREKLPESLLDKLSTRLMFVMK